MSEEQLISQNETEIPEGGDAAAEEPAQPEAEWYAVHTYSGYENKVKLDLAKRVESMNMQDKIFDILIPEEQEVEFKNGKKKTVSRRLFPGYVMVKMIMDNSSWYVVHHTPGVTGFVGAGGDALPIQKDEVEKILIRMGLQEKKPPQIIDARVGDLVRICAGPFEGLEGSILEIDSERGKLKISIAMFGRETAVELEYDQIQKI